MIHVYKISGIVQLIPPSRVQQVILNEKLPHANAWIRFILLINFISQQYIYIVYIVLHFHQ